MMMIRIVPTTTANLRARFRTWGRATRLHKESGELLAGCVTRVFPDEGASASRGKPGSQELESVVKRPVITGEEVPRAGTCRDARGKHVSVLDPAPLWLLERDEPIDRGTLQRIVEELGVPHGRSARPLWAGLAAFVVICLLAAGGVAFDIAREGNAAFRDLVGSLFITGPAVVFVIIAGCIVPLLIRRRERLARVREVMLAHGHCPHCGYRVGELPRDPADGAAVCPECASAWVLSVNA